MQSLCPSAVRAVIGQTLHKVSLSALSLTRVSLLSPCLSVADFETLTLCSLCYHENPKIVLAAFGCTNSMSLAIFYSIMLTSKFVHLNSRYSLHSLSVCVSCYCVLGHPSLSKCNLRYCRNVLSHWKHAFLVRFWIPSCSRPCYLQCFDVLL